MPKKKDTEVLEDSPEVQTPSENISVAPTLSESEQIVEGNKELAQVKADIAESRANFVKQTDSQITQIKELEDKISALTTDYNDKKNLIDEVYPVERKKFIDVQNKSSSALGKLQATQDELARKEDELAKGFEALATQKAAQDSRSDALESLSITLSKKEKDLNERDKAADGLKKALGIK